jgi:FKBP-type peptidyl-prolyl cis-trans isomerase FkpA
MNLKWLAIVILFFAALPAKAQTPEKPKTAEQPQQTPETQGQLFATQKEKISYVIGVNEARNVKTTLQNMMKLGLDLDPDLVLKGFKDALTESKLPVTDKEISELLKEIKISLDKKMQESDQAMAAKSKEEGSQFLQKNGKAEGVYLSAGGSGLQYKILTEGKGPKPTDEDIAVVHYIGTLINGTEFENTINRGKPVELPIAKLPFSGLREALKLMPVGSKWQLFLPSALGAGEKVISTTNGIVIPGNSVLIFEMQLLSIKPR